MERRFIENASIRAVGDDSAPQLDLLLAPFNDEYDMGNGCVERFGPHAFDYTINDDVRILLNHNSDIVLGRTVANTATLSIRADGLHSLVDINPEDRAALDSRARVKRGDISQCSIGFDILEELPPYKREDGKYVFTISRLKLYEGSICTFPAYEKTSAQARSIGSAAQMRAFKFVMKERLKNALESA